MRERPQMKTNPRNLKVSGFPSPRCLRLAAAWRPNSIRRVLSGWSDSSMAGLCTPLPTLRPHPRGSLRTARGRCGSLFLHRKGLSPSTPCRFLRTRLNFSSFLSLAAFRTRSSACDTRSRHWVRCVLCSSAFPSAPALCSTNSAASETPCSAWALASALFALFVGFPARIAGSDFSCSCIVG